MGEGTFFKIFKRYEQLISLVLTLSGIIIGSVCLFAIPPIGEIAMSALYFISELFIFAGAIIGVNLNFDHKLRKLTEQLGKEYPKNEKTE